MALLSACSAPSLVYNNATELVHWWLDGYVDLDTPQSVLVRKELVDIQLWHRQTELPRLANLLRDTAQRLPEPLTADAVCSVYKEVVASGERLSVKAETAVVALAASLTTAQVQAMERKYAKSNADYRAKWLGGSAAEAKERRYTQLLDRAESIYGRLNASQRELLRQQVVNATSTRKPPTPPGCATSKTRCRCCGTLRKPDPTSPPPATRCAPCSPAACARPTRSSAATPKRWCKRGVRAWRWCTTAPHQRSAQRPRAS